MTNDTPYVRTHEQALADGAACLEHALAYARLGWSVLCLCPPDHVGVGKAHGAGCGAWGKRPVGDGGRWKERQTTPATGPEVRAWWRVQPNANVGMALGPVSGVVRLDVEGDAAEARLAEVSGGDLPVTPEFASGKGRGLLYGLPEGVEARTGVEGLADGELRVQGLGAQTVLPPSRHRTGRPYAWLPGRAPWECAVAPAPGWLLERLKRGQQAADRLVPADGEVIPVRQCDTTLTSMAGAMRRRGFSEAAIRAALGTEIDAGRCETEQGKRPYDQTDAARIARSVARYEPDAYANVTVLRAAPSANGHPAPLTPFGPPKRASELQAVTEEALWLWRGYVSRGGITLLSALWKAGKTTLLAHLLRAFGDGGHFCGTEVRPARVLYVTEEHESLWAGRRDAVTFGDWVEFLIRPFGAKPDLTRWAAFLVYLQGVCRERSYDLIVFDTISNLWPVRDENDAAKVQESLMPLRAVSDMASFLLVHHLRKSDGAEATAARGSGAFPAFCDTLLELRRFDPAARKDRRRVLSGVGRYPETPDEVVLGFDDGLYRVLGDKADVRHASLSGFIAPELPVTPPGLTADQIHDGWRGDRPPGINTLRAALHLGAERGEWSEEGDGKRGDPYRYHRPRTDS
jgi:hypothetical protein